MSQSSPGRYGWYAFARNVLNVRAANACGALLEIRQNRTGAWTIPAVNGAAHIVYTVYGDRLDGTHLCIDETHLHMSLPAAIMRPIDHERKPVALSVEKPHEDWSIVTALPRQSQNKFLAQDWHHLMDCPIEVGPVSTETEHIGGLQVTLALHETQIPPTTWERRRFWSAMTQIVGECRKVFADTSTGDNFLIMIDRAPNAVEDAMEHRDCAVITTRCPLVDDEHNVLMNVVHEFIHRWNGVRLRPRDLEPFDFDGVNVCRDLWIVEGLTHYYTAVVAIRSGLIDMTRFCQSLTLILAPVMVASGRLHRSVEEISERGAFLDGNRPVDRTFGSGHMASFYSLGASVALGLDLAIRMRTTGEVSLDDVMARFWADYGRVQAGRAPHPYPPGAFEQCVATVVGDSDWVSKTFASHVRGTDLFDYEALLGAVGCRLRPRRPGASLGALSYEPVDRGLRIVRGVPAYSPLHNVGIAEDDTICRIDGHAVTSCEDLDRILADREPGETVQVAYESRDGRNNTKSVVLGVCPYWQVIQLESDGCPVTHEQMETRMGWIGSRSSTA